MHSCSHMFILQSSKKRYLKSSYIVYRHIIQKSYQKRNIKIRWSDFHKIFIITICAAIRITFIRFLRQFYIRYSYFLKVHEIWNSVFPLFCVIKITFRRVCRSHECVTILRLQKMYKTLFFVFTWSLNQDLSNFLVVSSVVQDRNFNIEYSMVEIAW